MAKHIIKKRYLQRTIIAYILKTHGISKKQNVDWWVEQQQHWIGMWFDVMFQFYGYLLFLSFVSSQFLVSHFFLWVSDVCLAFSYSWCTLGSVVKEKSWAFTTLEIECPIFLTLIIIPQLYGVKNSQNPIAATATLLVYIL